MDAQVKQYLVELVNAGPRASEAWLKANTKGGGVKRRAYVEVDKHLRQFQTGKTDREWLIMPGLRGTGKTTLLMQVYHELRIPPGYKFFVSLERVRIVGGTVNDLLTVLEESIGSKFEEVTEPVYLFLDEVQYLKDWALVIKALYDRTGKLFVICTGSSAIQLQTNADVVRRSDRIPIHPLCFTEYVMIRHAHEGKRPDLKALSGIPVELRNALFNSTGAAEVYSRLQNLGPRITRYWQSVAATPEERVQHVADYVNFGTLPFTLTIPEEVVRWQRISQLLNESLNRDLVESEKFDTATVADISRLLFLLAASDTISFQRIADALSRNVRTVRALLDALVSTEILNSIPPRGSAYKKTRRSSKYLFTSPSMRAALCNSGGVLTEKPAVLRGRMLEDLVGMYLNRIFRGHVLATSVIEYDYAEGAADFIVSPDGTRQGSIALEVGATKKTASQATKTRQAVNGKYSLVISNSPLRVDMSAQAVFVPFNYFALA